VNNTPKFVDQGMKMIIGILTGIGNNIYQVVTAGTRIITEFIRGIGDNAGKVADEAAKTVVKFVNGAADAVTKNTGDLKAAGGKLATAIIDGLTGGLASGVTSVIRAAKGMAQSAYDAAMGFLQAHSPSRLFMKVGGYIPQGMAIGMGQYEGVVAAAAESVGQTALDSMKKSIVGLNDIVMANVDPNPTITPVLDLTNVQRDATKIGSLLQSTPFAIGSLDAATSALNGYAANTGGAADAQAQDRAISAPVTFIQNNNSPKALSTAEIYRQTKNQLSVAKEGANA
jgi:hypothetical protein